MVIESLLSALFFHQQLAFDSTCVHRHLHSLPSFTPSVCLALASSQSHLGVCFAVIYIIYLRHSHFHSHILPREDGNGGGENVCSPHSTHTHAHTYIIIETMTIHYFHHFWLTVAVAIRAQAKRNKSCVSSVAFRFFSFLF